MLSSVALAGSHARKQSQDVAEAARQERARKQEQQKLKRHVYTNEDLSHAKILTPEDEARLEAKKNECAKKNNCEPAEKSQEGFDANSQKPGTSLGEVAREYRKQKETQKQLDALKPKQSEPFHLPASDPALASPILPGRPAMRQPVAPALRPGTNAHVMRRDPFARVPMQVAPPEVQTEVSRESVRPVAGPDFPGDDFFGDVHPTIGRSARRKSPRAPKISSPFAPTLIPVQPALPFAPAVVPSDTFATTPIATPELKSLRPKETGAAAEPKSVRPEKSSAPPDAIAPKKSRRFAETVRPTEPARIVPAAPSVSGKTISVKQGDSLWRVAQENLGSGSRWPELLVANPWIANPDRIRTGAQLALPAAAEMPTFKPAGKHRTSTIRVQKGDTMWSLAKAKLGRWSAWPCLASANPAVSDPNRIVEGQELVVPAACRDSNRDSLLPDEK